MKGRGRGGLLGNKREGGREGVERRVRREGGS